MHIHTGTTMSIEHLQDILKWDIGHFTSEIGL